MWTRHWGLARDPFSGMDSPYVPLPSHEEALARLIVSVEQRQRVTGLIAGPGMGKTTILRRAITEIRNSRRRALLLQAPSDSGLLLGRIADGLGLPSAVGSDRERLWRALGRALRARAIEGVHVVLVVDGWDTRPDRATMQDMMALLDADGPGSASHSLIRAGTVASDDSANGPEAWAPAIGLERLTRSELERYLGAKIGSAGCRERLFTPRAMSRLHSWSEGIPKAIDELASLSLAAGADQGLEVVTPEVVDGVAL
jgi:general secretion pathway protein A